MAAAADPSAKGAAVRRMFGRIAGRYDLMNRLMTFGRDQAWRRFVVRKAAPPPAGRLLDVATGTGRIAAEASRRFPRLSVAACDFSLEMMARGRTRQGSSGLLWCCGDGLALPFADAVFDAVTSGFLVRNVADPLAAFREQVRVLRPGGRLVCLDTSPPPPGWRRPLVRFQLSTVIPMVGRWVTGDAEAYRYLPESTLAFRSPRALADLMESAGLEKVAYRTFMLDTIVVLYGRKPAVRVPPAGRRG